jgi:hypothetical protein
MAYPMQRPASCILPASVPCITPRPPLSTPAPNGAPAHSTSTLLPISQPICHKAFNTPCTLLPFRRPPSAPLRRRRGLPCHVCESALSHAYSQRPVNPHHLCISDACCGPSAASVCHASVGRHGPCPYLSASCQVCYPGPGNLSPSTDTRMLTCRCTSCPGFSNHSGSPTDPVPEMRSPAATP